jgi:GTPase SAR1 family protein
MNPKEFKIVLLGDSAVGKSSLMVRFVTGDFRFGSSPTIGAAYMSKAYNYDKETVNFQVNHDSSLP